MISVILPTFNRSNMIVRSICSVLNQTYKDFELIIVDDGSTDCTQDMVSRIKDSRIRYIRHEKNKGAAAARNTGIKAAQCDLIAFQDSDDEWVPEKLEKQIKAILALPDDFGVIYSAFWRLGKQKIYIPRKNISIKEGWMYKQLLYGNIVGMPVSLIKKECFNVVGGFSENLRALEDWELFLRISKFFKFKYIDEPLVLSYETEGSVSKNVLAHTEAYEYILANNYSAISIDKKLLAQYIYIIGRINFQAGDVQKGKEYLIKAWKERPFNVKYNVAVILSFFGKEIFGNIIRLKSMLRNIFTNY